jgi:hypothetical protein
MSKVACNMVRICRLSKLLLMTLIAVAVDKLVVIVCVTRLALCVGVPASQSEARCRVVERGWPPGCRCMTLHAICRKITLHVIRVCSSVEIHTMTVNTVCRSAGELVVLMALRA